MDVRTVVVRRPKPTKIAEAGLRHIETLTINFADASVEQEEAAREYIDELIAWWKLIDVRYKSR